MNTAQAIAEVERLTKSDKLHVREIEVLIKENLELTTKLAGIKTLVLEEMAYWKDAPNCSGHSGIAACSNLFARICLGGEVSRYVGTHDEITRMNEASRSN